MIRHSRKGAALLEFALWLLPILILLTGVVEVSRMLSLEHQVSRAARDATRVGSMVMSDPLTGGPATESVIEAAAIDHGVNILNDSGYNCASGCVVTATWYVNTSGRYLLTVHVEYPFTPLIGLLDFDRPVVREFTMMTQFQR